MFVVVVQRRKKEKKTATVLLDLTRLSEWLHFSTIVSTCLDSKVEGFSPPYSFLVEAGRKRE